LNESLTPIVELPRNVIELLVGAIAELLIFEELTSKR